MNAPKVTSAAQAVVKAVEVRASHAEVLNTYDRALTATLIQHAGKKAK